MGTRRCGLSHISTEKRKEAAEMRSTDKRVLSPGSVCSPEPGLLLLMARPLNCIPTASRVFESDASRAFFFQLSPFLFSFVVWFAVFVPRPGGFEPSVFLCADGGGRSTLLVMTPIHVLQCVCVCVCVCRLVVHVFFLLDLFAIIPIALLEK